jgi:phospholipase D1/2
MVQLEGPAAWDVLANFQQRWTKQGKEGVTLITPAPPHFLTFEQDVAIAEGTPHEWHMRIVRSINSHSAALPGASIVHTVKEQGIQKAYVEMVRAAKRFIYIENQYFMGSCYYWNDDRSSSCKQMVPYEIAQRLARGILEYKPVTAYIVMPMYPEGYPEVYNS